MKTNHGRLGILFAGGDGPPPEWLRALLSQDQYLSPDPESAPLLVAADSGLLLAEQVGLRPHWIIGDMDSLEAESLDSYPPEIVLRYPADKDYTDTELAFSLLREKGCGPVWIIGGGGGRIDHLFGINALFEREYPPERWITALEDIHCLQAPSGIASKEFHAKSIIPSNLEVSSVHAPLDPVSVFPLGYGPWEAESSGLTWPIDGFGWQRGFFGLSNRAPNGAFSVAVKQGRFFVMVPLE